MYLKGIEHIVFDLGGVLLNIEPEISFREFRRLNLMDENKFKELFIDQNLLFDLETGKVDDVLFRNRIRDYASKTVTDAEIDHAWNALLLDFPKTRYSMLCELRKKCGVYLLSNTNVIHYKSYSAQFERVYQRSFESLFDRLFLSYEMGFRKPDLQIFEKMMLQGNLKSENILFIDDTFENVEAAINSGIQAFHLTKDLDVTELMTVLVQF